MKTFYQLNNTQKKKAISLAELEITRLLEKGFLADDGDYTTNQVRVLACMAAEGSYYSDLGNPILKEICS